MDQFAVPKEGSRLHTKTARSSVLFLLGLAIGTNWDLHLFDVEKNFMYGFASAARQFSPLMDSLPQSSFIQTSLTIAAEFLLPFMGIQSFAMPKEALAAR